ncbi:MAG: hypothetical protein ACLTSZ_14840 [Lachnospiraceae bacterium]
MRKHTYVASSPDLCSSIPVFVEYGDSIRSRLEEISGLIWVYHVFILNKRFPITEERMNCRAGWISVSVETVCWCGGKSRLLDLVADMKGITPPAMNLGLVLHVSVRRV